MLRNVGAGELDQLFEGEQDAAAVEMAAFTHADPSDRAAFDAHYERIRNDSDNNAADAHRSRLGVRGATRVPKGVLDPFRPAPFARLLLREVES